MIKLINVSKHYRDKLIFDNVNFQIDKPGIYLIKGKNGSGKTTLLNIISKLTTYEGEVNNSFLDDMGYLWQNCFLITDLTLKEHLELFKLNEHLLKKYNLEDKLYSYPNELSDGERQRIGIILALHGDNTLVILDEPISNLNERYAQRILKDIIKYKKKKIILIVSHNEKFFESCKDGVIKIDNHHVDVLMCNKDNKSYITNRETRKKITKTGNYLRGTLSLVGIMSIFLFILFILNMGEIIVVNLINKDKINNLEYNKYYLKECHSVNNNGYEIVECYNPSYDNLKELNYYGYNYDYLLSFLYSRNDLKVISNEDVFLKKGRYPLDANEVIANDSYQIGDVILIESNVILSNVSVDFYKDKRELVVVGIYNDLIFKKVNNIYFDYDLLAEYFDSEMLINNKINMNEYYQDLKIDRYKYLSFVKEDINKVEYQGNEESYYDMIDDVLDKSVVILDSLKTIIVISMIYFFIRSNRILLERKRKGYGYLVSNGFNRTRLLILDLRIYVLMILVNVFMSLIVLIVGQSFVYLKEFVIVALSLLFILSYQFKNVYCRKSIGLIMRDSYA